MDSNVIYGEFETVVWDDIVNRLELDDEAKAAIKSNGPAMYDALVYAFWENKLGKSADGSKNFDLVL